MKPPTVKTQVAVLTNEIKNMRAELSYFTKELKANNDKDEIYRKITTENKTAIRWIWGALVILFGAISTVLYIMPQG